MTLQNDVTNVPVLLCLAAFVVASSGCSNEKQALDDQRRLGLKTLEKTVKLYGQLNSFSAKIGWLSGPPESQEPTESRRLYFVRPAKMSVTSTVKGLPSNKFVLNAKEFMEQSSTGLRVMTMKSANGWKDSQIMKHPTLCGLLLIKVLTANGELSALVKSSKSIREVQPVMLNDGTKCRVVQFDAGPPYGVSQIVVTESTGIIRRLAFDGGKNLDLRRSDGLPPIMIQEIIEQSELNPTIPDSEFEIATTDDAEKTTPKSSQK